MKRIVFLGLVLLTIFLPYFFLWSASSRGHASDRTRYGSGYHHHYYGGWWMGSGWRWGTGDFGDYRGKGANYRGGGPGFGGK